MKLINDSWVDDNNNSWDSLTNTEAEAQAKSDSLINCKDCDDCTHCTNCRNCSSCHRCTGCDDCSSCLRSLDLSDCQGCKDCAGCERCFDCTSCTDCYECYDSVECNNCDDCIRCENCKFTLRKIDEFELDETFKNGDNVDFQGAKAVYIGWYRDKRVLAVRGELVFVEPEQLKRLG